MEVLENKNDPEDSAIADLGRDVVDHFRILQRIHADKKHVEGFIGPELERYEQSLPGAD
jgi:hypothetical protein